MTNTIVSGDWVRFGTKNSPSALYLAVDVSKEKTCLINPTLKGSNKNKLVITGHLQQTALRKCFIGSYDNQKYFVTAKGTIVSMASRNVVWAHDCPQRIALLNDMHACEEHQEEVSLRDTISSEDLWEGVVISSEELTEIEHEELATPYQYKATKSPRSQRECAGSAGWIMPNVYRPNIR
jgi:hypothetical protein